MGNYDDHDTSSSETSSTPRIDPALSDLLSRCYSVLMDAGEFALAEEVLEAAFPVNHIPEPEDREDDSHTSSQIGNGS